MSLKSTNWLDFCKKTNVRLRAPGNVFERFSLCLHAKTDANITDLRERLKLMTVRQNGRRDKNVFDNAQKPYRVRSPKITIMRLNIENCSKNRRTSSFLKNKKIETLRTIIGIEEFLKDSGKYIMHCILHYLLFKHFFNIIVLSLVKKIFLQLSVYQKYIIINLNNHLYLLEPQ